MRNAVNTIRFREILAYNLKILKSILFYSIVGVAKLRDVHNHNEMA